MKNRIRCHCGSGKAMDDCCGKAFQINVKEKAFSHPSEREEMLKKIEISSQFHMRYRGLFEFYGDDFIAYKSEQMSDETRNEFLRLISEYMTDHLENYCPSSWLDCKPSFWEELIVTYFPTKIKLTPQQNQVENFKTELEKFVYWLDIRKGTSWKDVVNGYIQEASSELNICEQLLNSLYLNDFPHLHQDDWNLEEDIERLEESFNNYHVTVDGLFQVTDINIDTIVLVDMESRRSYNVKGLPCQLFKVGILLDGMVGKRRDDMFWNWCHTEGIYPKRAKKHFVLTTI